MYSRIKYLTPEILNDDDRIAAYFSLRNQGNIHTDREIPGLNLGLNTDESPSVVWQNREELLKALGIESSKIAYAKQVHETHVEVVEEGGTFDKTDALVSNTPGMALAIQVADCAAVLMADADNKVIGAAHAGWRGAVAGIVSKTIASMKELGAETDKIKVFISPCISLKNFEVGDEVAEKFPKELVDRTNYRKAHVDLKRYIEMELQQNEIASTQIQTDPECTIDNSDLYSYRRQKQKSGRMMGIIQLK